MAQIDVITISKFKATCLAVLDKVKCSLIEKLNEKIVPLYEDVRGNVRSFVNFSVKDLHIASMLPDTVRGNHTLEKAEVICVIGGDGICEIEVLHEASGESNKDTCWRQPSILL